ncbi:glutamine-hydrolyzing carbamoyl-phosphate synthase small subunit [Camelimonas abortus]|uniref:Carbamoyl phosphate synthase small chain n=1 Tax=Camelimonas abortus TaxID=1017184 RepID=A0ABV7LEX9_9HYPH
MLQDSTQQPAGWSEPTATALLVLADGTVIEGSGIGAEGKRAGEVCFNTAMTGYEEIITDPSYAGQIITFTFPHIGNVGVNDEDIEALNAASGAGAVGVVVHADITGPANWRASRHLNDWLKARGVVGIAGVDTRALAAMTRERGMQNAILVHAPDGRFDVEALKREAAALPSMAGLDLTGEVSAAQRMEWTEGVWTLGSGYGRPEQHKYHIVAMDFGVKRNILRLFADRGCKVTVVPGRASLEEILALKPDGVFISNGPGDPAATCEWAAPVIAGLVERRVPTFGICLGHQMLAIALGGRTVKMTQGHHGANHPVQDLETKKVEIVSMNHGFAVDPASLPPNVKETHRSLFDGSNCGIAVTDRPAFSVQHHPEASPGPQDSHYLFDRFLAMIDGERARRQG